MAPVRSRSSPKPKRTTPPASSGARKRAAARSGGSKAEGHAAIEAWIEQVKPELRPIVKRLDEVIRSVVPGLRYVIKWRAPFYGLPEKGWILSMAAFKAHVDVNFFGGAGLKPPPPFGESERMRHAKVASLGEVDDPRLRAWIEQAQHIQGRGRV